MNGILAGGRGRRVPLGRSFSYLWTASGASNLGDGILLVGAPLLAVTLTRSPFLVSLVTAAVWLPWLLLALHAGAIADRLDRRTVMVAASWSRAAVLSAVAGWTVVGELNLAVLCGAVFLVGVAEVFSDTSAQSMLPTIVDKERLGDANGRLVAAQTVANNFLGAPVAGVLVGLASSLVFGVAGLCYALAALLLIRIGGGYRPDRSQVDPSRSAPTSTQSLRSDIAAGLSYLWRHRLLRGLAVAAGLINLASNAYFAVFVLWAVGSESQVGLTAAGYGIASGTLGVGAVVGSLLADRITRTLGRAQTLLAGLLVISGLMVVPVLLPMPRVIYVVMFLLGSCSAVINVIVVSMRQLLVPDELLGRVNASYRMIGMGGIPFGALGGGAIGSAFGLPAVFYTAVGLCVVAAALVGRSVSPGALVAAERPALGSSGRSSDAAAEKRVEE